MASAAEAYFCGLFANAREGEVIRTTLEKLGHEQLPTPITTDNSTASGIVNYTIKQQRSKIHRRGILLDSRLCHSKKLSSPLAPWQSKPGRLSHKIACFKTSPTCPPTLCTQAQFTKRYTL